MTRKWTNPRNSVPGDTTNARKIFAQSAMAKHCFADLLESCFDCPCSKNVMFEHCYLLSNSDACQQDNDVFRADFCVCLHWLCSRLLAGCLVSVSWAKSLYWRHRGCNKSHGGNTVCSQTTSRLFQKQGSKKIKRKTNEKPWLTYWIRPERWACMLWVKPQTRRRTQETWSTSVWLRSTCVWSKPGRPDDPTGYLSFRQSTTKGKYLDSSTLRNFLMRDWTQNETFTPTTKEKFRRNVVHDLW